MSRWLDRDDVQRGASYDTRWEALADAGENIHGEADLIESLLAADSPAPTVMDAGCGTGRVAIELARRGVDVVGVDIDPHMLDQARAKAPQLQWVLSDLVQVRDDRRFDLVAMPGNVMIFVEPGSEAAVVANLANHLTSGGLLVAGFQLGTVEFGLDDYDRCCAAVGLALRDRWSTWDRQPYEGGDYAVSVHRC